MKTIIKTFLAVTAAVAVSACDGDRYDLLEMTTDPYHKVLGFQDAQYENMHLYNASEPVTVSFKVLKGGSDPESPCSMKVSSIPQEELSGYSQAYIAVPKSYYTVDGTFDFQPGEPSKDVSVTFSAEGIAKMKTYCEEVTAAGNQLVLGIRIESEDATVNSNKSELFRIIDVTDPMFEHSVVGADNSINNLLGFDALDKCNLYDLPRLLFSLQGTENQWNSEFTVKYRKDLAERYNQTNGTSYSILDEGVIGFESETVQLAPGENELSISLVKGTGAIPDATRLYLFPVEVVNSRFGTDLTTNEDDELNNNVIYLVLGSEVKLNVSDLYSPCTATGHGSSDGGGLASLINNTLGDDFWSSNWDNSYQSKDWHHFIQVRFTEPLTEGVRVQYWNRPDLNPCPTEIEIWVTDKASVEERDSKDGWVLLGSYNMTDDGLPVSADPEDPWSSPSYLFSGTEGLEGKSITYMRFCMVKSQDSGGNGEQEVGYGASSVSISELKVWGN